jgi:hypothetical protein
MTDGRLHLDAKVALDGARNLTAAGRHYRALLTGPGADVAEVTGKRPWGADDIGQSFETNYRPIEQQVFQAWEQLARYVEGLGEAAAASVADNQQADQESGMRVTRAYRERP